MIEIYKQAIRGQYEATLCVLGQCIDRCPSGAWDAPVAKLAFCQAAFHVLFFTDLYLDTDEPSFRRQPFHLENKSFFGDYEELEDRPQQMHYRREPTQRYLQHCVQKANVTVASETVDSLSSPCNYDWLSVTRAELHVCNIRHIAHHAAQLSLRLRLDGGHAADWVKTGWLEA